MAGALSVFCTMFMRSANADLTQAIAPLPLPGPYAVACSNVTQDFSRMAPGEDVQNYWEGVPRSDGSSRYITDLLSDTGNTLALTVNAPGNDDVYGSFAGHSIAFVVVVCYPTSASNSRPDYPLPNGVVVPHMQRGADAPLLADPATRFPLLLFSHGLLGSPLSNDYLQAMSDLCQQRLRRCRPFPWRRTIFPAPTRKPERLSLPAHAFARLQRDAGPAAAARCRRRSTCCLRIRNGAIIWTPIASAALARALAVSPCC